MALLPPRLLPPPKRSLLLRRPGPPLADLQRGQCYTRPGRVPVLGTASVALLCSPAAAPVKFPSRHAAWLAQQGCCSLRGCIHPSALALRKPHLPLPSVGACCCLACRVVAVGDGWIELDRELPFDSECNCTAFLVPSLFPTSCAKTSPVNALHQLVQPPAGQRRL